MKKEEILSLIRLLLAPVLVILLGLVLLVNPDSASILISRVLGGGLAILAVGFGIAALVSARGRAGKAIASVALAVCGGLLSRNPLWLASFAGRVVGILLVIDGVQDMLHAHCSGVRVRMPLVVALLGAILVLMPMTASRLVFSLCGLVVTVVGVIMLLERLGKPRLSGGKRDIIDME